jgi:hypothetical protein
MRHLDIVSPMFFVEIVSINRCRFKPVKMKRDMRTTEFAENKKTWWNSSAYFIRRLHSITCLRQEDVWFLLLPNLHSFWLYASVMNLSKLMPLCGFLSGINFSLCLRVPLLWLKLCARLKEGNRIGCWKMLPHKANSTVLSEVFPRITIKY